MDSRDRSWLAIGIAVFIAVSAGQFHNEAPQTPASYQAPADERYVQAAERAGYKGSDAENVAAAAKRLCQGTGGTDC